MVKGMECLPLRIASFTKKRPKWPHPTNKGFKATPETLAEAGFYFCPAPGDRDNVACYICDKQVGEWEKDDDPFELHWRKCGVNGGCAWAVVRCCEEEMSYTNKSQFKDPLRYPTSPALEEARLATFQEGHGWPHDASTHHGATSAKLAAAGFIFAPSEPGDDLAACLYCQVALNGWDEDDDPIAEHKKRRPDCMFLQFFASAPSKPSTTRTRGHTRTASRMLSKQHEDLVMPAKVHDGSEDDHTVSIATTVVSTARTPRKKANTAASSSKTPSRARVKKGAKTPARPRSTRQTATTEEESDAPKRRGRSKSVARTDLDEQSDPPPKRQTRKTRSKSIVPPSEDEQEFLTAPSKKSKSSAPPSDIESNTSVAVKAKSQKRSISKPPTERTREKSVADLFADDLSVEINKAIRSNEPEPMPMKKKRSKSRARSVVAKEPDEEENEPPTLTTKKKRGKSRAPSIESLFEDEHVAVPLKTRSKSRARSVVPPEDEDNEEPRRGRSVARAPSPSPQRIRRSKVDEDEASSKPVKMNPLTKSSKPTAMDVDTDNLFLTATTKMKRSVSSTKHPPMDLDLPPPSIDLDEEMEMPPSPTPNPPPRRASSRTRTTSLVRKVSSSRTVSNSALPPPSVVHSSEMKEDEESDIEKYLPPPSDAPLPPSDELEIEFPPIEAPSSLHMLAPVRPPSRNSTISQSESRAPSRTSILSRPASRAPSQVVDILSDDDEDNLPPAPSQTRPRASSMVRKVRKKSSQLKVGTSVPRDTDRKKSEAEGTTQEEAERSEQEKVERLQKEENERIQKEEATRLAQQEALRLEAKLRAKDEAELKAKEEKQRKELRERLRREREEQAAREREENAQKEREEREELELLKQQEKEREAAEREETERRNREEQERQEREEAERQALLDKKRRKEEERLRREEEKRRKEEEARERKRLKEEERKKREEIARIEKERKKEETRKRHAEEKRLKEEAEAARRAEEAERHEREKAEEARLADEARRHREEEAQAVLDSDNVNDEDIEMDEVEANIIPSEEVPCTPPRPMKKLSSLSTRNILQPSANINSPHPPALAPFSSPTKLDAASEQQFYPVIGTTPFSNLTDLTEAELNMTVEEWIKQQMEKEVQQFREDALKELKRFEEEAAAKRAWVESWVVAPA
ncbi:hypothetical protein DL96DRAFT_1591991 [Flagelloscypha sp. PMI_526]|nr:hypothetical protein DL96DRAFT_1591991 [Flagelloscypha sp. PMI_526]